MRVPFSPYEAGEFLSMVARRFSAPPPRSASLDREVSIGDEEPDRWIGFVGDICPLFGRTARFGSGVHEFLSPCDVVVGNFEGVFSDRLWRPFLMKHSSEIFGALSKIKPLKDWVVSVANNHATDFGTEALERTVGVLDRQGIRWLGTTERPRLSLTEDVTCTAWTWWLNRPDDGVSQSNPGAPSTPGVHMALPHWGYEHERQPRPSQTVPAGYTLTVGHHTHLPQPFERRDNGQWVAWSLGNFVTGKQLPVLGEGALLKVGVYTPSEGTPSIVQARFRELDLERNREECHVTLRHSSASSADGTANGTGPTG